ncbi:MAG: MFS transporter, partial [Verrucomicrobium sp.]
MSAVTQLDPRFRQAQRRVLGSVMFCYLFYYTGRQTFGFAMPGIQAELGLDKQTLGWVSAAMLWAYAVGQAVNGNLGDRFGGRRMMALGTGLSFVMNWVTSFGMGFKSLITAWGINGLAQSMGWAPGSRLVANWFGVHER